MAIPSGGGIELQNLANKVQQYLKQNKLDKRHRALALVLSLAVVISVFGSLIMPAISMSSSEETQPTAVVAAPRSADNPANFKENVTGVTATFNKIEGEQADVKFKFTFKLEGGVLREDNKDFVYKLPNNFTWQGDQLGNNFNITINNENCGIFYIAGDATSGYTLNVQFSSAYINGHKTECEAGFSGELEFEAAVVRDKSELENVTVSFPANGENIPIEIPFDKRSASVSKSGTSNGDGTITWKVDIYNGGNNLNGFELSDTVFGTDAPKDLTFDPAGCGTYADGKVTFNDTTNGKDNIYLTYKTDVPMENKFNGGEVSNTATLKPTDPSEKEIKDTAKINVNSSIGLEKSGEYDYLSDGGINGKTNWTVKLTNKDGTDLNGFVITDSKFPVSLNDITVSGIDKSKLQLVDGTITINGGSDPITSSEIVFSYSAPVDEAAKADNGHDTNTVTVKPDRNSTVEKTQTTDYWQRYNPVNGLSKSAGRSGDNDVKWTINADGYGLTSGFSGETFTDPMFKLASDVTVKNKKDWSIIPESAYTFDKDNGTLTFNDTVDSSLVNVEISYRVSIEEILKSEDASIKALVTTETVGGVKKYSIKNSVDWNDLHKEQTCEYTPPQNKIEKEATEVKTEDGKTLVRWRIYYENSENGLGGLNFTDALSVDGKGGHYLTEEQLNATNFEVYFGSDKYHLLNVPDSNMKYKLDSSAMTITPITTADGKTTKLEIKVPDTYIVNDQYGAPKSIADFDKICISYWATVDGDVGDTVKTLNDVQTDENTKAQGEKDVTITDPNKLPYRKFDATGFNKDNGLAGIQSEETTKHKLSELQMVQVKVGADTVDYYVLDWGVIINEDFSITGQKEFDLTDTLPAGFELGNSIEPKCISFDASGNKNEWKINVFGSGDTPNGNEYVQVVSDTGSGADKQQKLHLHLSQRDMTNVAYAFVYRVRIPKAELDKMLTKGTVDIVNTVGDDEHEPAKQTQTVTKGELTKTADAKALKNGIKYTVDVNPKGIDYDPTRDTIELSDLFKLSDPTVKVGLKDIQVDVLDENLNVVSTLTEGSGFKYVFSQRKDLDKEASDSKPQPKNNSIALSVNAGDVISADVVRSADYTGDLKGNFTYTDGSGTTQTSDWSGEGEHLFTVPAGATDVKFNTTNGSAEVTLSKVTYVDSDFSCNILRSDLVSYDSTSESYKLSSVTWTDNVAEFDVNPGDEITVSSTLASGYYSYWVSLRYNGSTDLLNKEGTAVVPEGVNKLTLSYNSDGPLTYVINKKSPSKEKITQTTCIGECPIPTNDYAARLKLTVPDDKRLRITYSYSMSYVGTEDKTGVTAENRVSAMMSGSPHNASNVASFDLSNAGSGLMWTGSPVSLIKTDIGDTGKRLEATFELYRYNSTTKTWDAALKLEGTKTAEGVFDGYKVTEWGQGDAAEIKTIASVSEDYLLKVRNADISDTKSYLYKLQEVKAPDGYHIIGKGGYYFTVNTLPADVDLTDTNIVPAERTVHNISDGGKIKVKNYCNIELTVGKQWIGSTWDNYEYVECELIRSATQASEGQFPAGYEVIKLAKGADGAYAPSDTGDATFKLNGLDKITIKDLPNGNSKNLTYYYYVRELSYKPNGEAAVTVDENCPFDPIYFGNGASTDGEITITNSSALKVVKEWHRGTPAAGTEINVDLYRSTVNAITLPEGAEKIGTIALNADSDWAWESSTDAELNAKIIKTDDDGNTYYYYAVETNCPEGYSVSVNHTNSTGIITIVNTKDVEDTGAHLPETGGDGTVPYKIAGAAIACTAVVLLATKRRRSARNK